jgi:hypothetical protein
MPSENIAVTIKTSHFLGLDCTDQSNVNKLQLFNQSDLSMRDLSDELFFEPDFFTLNIAGAASLLLGSKGNPCLTFRAKKILKLID